MNDKSPNSRPSALPPDIARLGFEEAMGELEKLVRQLEKGDAKLEDAISAFERGSLLKRHCEARLREAQMKIERITVSEDGKVSVKTFET